MSQSNRIECAACGKSYEGESGYAIHRDGFGKGPEVPLCVWCGSEEHPTEAKLWQMIAARSSTLTLEKAANILWRMAPRLVDRSRVRDEGGGCFVVSVYIGRLGLSTYDSADLTRAVIVAHDARVRLAIQPSGPRMLKLQITQRDKSSDSFGEYHPSLDEAVRAHRDGLDQHNPNRPANQRSL